MSETPASGQPLSQHSPARRAQPPPFRTLALQTRLCVSSSGAAGECADPLDPACLGAPTTDSLRGCSGHGVEVCRPACTCQCDSGWVTPKEPEADGTIAYCSEKAADDGNLAARTLDPNASSAGAGCEEGPAALLCGLTGQLEYFVLFLLVAAASVTVCLCCCCGPQRTWSACCSPSTGCWCFICRCRTDAGERKRRSRRRSGSEDSHSPQHRRRRRSSSWQGDDDAREVRRRKYGDRRRRRASSLDGHSKDGRRRERGRDRRRQSGSERRAAGSFHRPGPARGKRSSTGGSHSSRSASPGLSSSSPAARRGHATGGRAAEPVTNDGRHHQESFARGRTPRPTVEVGPAVAAQPEAWPASTGGSLGPAPLFPGAGVGLPGFQAAAWAQGVRGGTHDLPSASYDTGGLPSLPRHLLQTAAVGDAQSWIMGRDDLKQAIQLRAMMAMMGGAMEPGVDGGFGGLPSARQAFPAERWRANALAFSPPQRTTLGSPSRLVRARGKVARLPDPNNG